MDKDLVMEIGACRLLLARDPFGIKSLYIGQALMVAICV